MLLTMENVTSRFVNCDDAFKDDNTAAGLFYMLSMIIIYNYMYESTFTYNYCMHRWCDDVYVSVFAVGFYLCPVIGKGGILHMVYVCVDIM